MRSDVNERDKRQRSARLSHGATMPGLLLSVTLLLGGCATSSIGTTSDTLCAGRQPIQYNSKNPKSDYYAAKKLAPQIAVANQTGVNLKCKAFD